ncbi:hypothetical protein [Alteromonas halophila]|uniref:DUF2384 domain-containing protein n=1 Tax=Alteromonas halophila TaxID=516698 RepID=A0A918JGW2_9ALTE|nr:hypothetical protein [Alteromonas halophila]GGW78045.1 hypothetical protein GCM10007391_08250 [Alteromonas halophila]
MQSATYPPAVLTKAFTWAYEELGLNTAEAAHMLGLSDTALQQTALVGFPGDSPQTSVQLAFIRFYYQLITVFSGDSDRMRSWFHNHHDAINTTPKAICDSQEGIARLYAILTGADVVPINDRQDTASRVQRQEVS